MTAAASVDHCTGWFEGTWSHCCAAHDLAYADPTIDRLTADIDLAACVAATSGGPIMGSVMFVGVALFGWWFRRKALRRAQAR